MSSYKIPTGFDKCEADLSNTGMIQGFGCLLKISYQSKSVISASANIEKFLGRSSLIGKKISEIFTDEIENRLWNYPFYAPIHESWNNLKIYGYSDESGILLEIEDSTDLPKRRPRFNLFGIKTREELISRTLQRLQEESGFERVMLYEFLPDGAGQVSAELYQGSGDLYLGLRYPATDIPTVARKLYLRNAYRYIYDASVEPIPILNAKNEVDSTINLSYSFLRNVSPFHAEYLKNMGVKCTLSFSLIKDANLIGMLSLQNSEPKFISQESRLQMVQVAKEYLHNLNIRDSEDRMQFLDSYRREVTAFISNVNNILEHKDEIEKFLQLVGASGLAIKSGGEWKSFGNINISEKLISLEESITNVHPKGIFSTDCISSAYVGMEEEKSQISGVMCIWYTHLTTREKITYIFVKPEVLQEVIWGSRVEFYPGNVNPINSFGQWKEMMKFHSKPWTRQAHNAAQAILYVGLSKTF